MTYTKHICIGGGNDGYSIEVPDGAREWSVQIVHRAPISIPFSEPSIADKILRTDVYRKERIRCDGEDIELLIVRGLPTIGAIRRLLSYYNPNPVER